MIRLCCFCLGEEPPQFVFNSLQKIMHNYSVNDIMWKIFRFLVDEGVGERMKKILYTALMTMLVIVLGACNGNKTNTISVADLTDREEDILSMITEQSFLFDYNVDDTYQEVTFWVEKYESGKLVEKINNEAGAPIHGSGSLIFAIAQDPEDKNLLTFLTGLKNEDAKDGDIIPSFSGSVTGKKELDKATWRTQVIQESVPIKGEMTLASLCYTFDDNGITQSSTDFNEDPEKYMDELKEFDVAFLLKGEFK